MESKYAYFVGIDWGTQQHQVHILDVDRATVLERTVEHSGEAIAKFLDELTERTGGQPERVAVGIEIPRGTLVESLLERGFHVYVVNPKQLDRFRDRHSVAGAKDDRLDSFVLAEALRTDLPLFRRVQVDDPTIIQIREIARAEEDLKRDFLRLTNRLREQLHRIFPALLKLVPAADEPWLWDLLELAPTPEAARTLDRARVEELLRAKRIRRLGADAVLEQLTARAVSVAPGTVEAVRTHVEMLLPRLRLVLAQRKDCDRRIERLLEQLAEAPLAEGHKGEHRDVEILRSLPGVGNVVAATMLAEAAQALTARDYHALRAHAGVAPVTRASGKRSGKKAQVIMRRGCSDRMRDALYHGARVAVQRDELCRAQYQALRDRGHRHGRALRAVADRMLRILIAMLRNGTLYDPTRLTRSRTVLAAPAGSVGTPPAAPPTPRSGPAPLAQGMARVLDTVAPGSAVSIDAQRALGRARGPAALCAKPRPPVERPGPDPELAELLAGLAERARAREARLAAAAAGVTTLSP